MNQDMFILSFFSISLRIFGAWFLHEKMGVARV